MKDFFANIENIIKPFLEGVLEFFNNELYIIYAGIAIVLVIIVLTGLIVALKKFPKFFLFVVFVVGVFCALSYFFYYKG